MKRALFISPSAYTLGGLATWLDYLIPGLEDIGWRATLGLTAGRYHDVRRYLADHPAQDWIAIPNPTGSRAGRVRSLYRAMQATKPDVIVGVNIADTYPAVNRYRRETKLAPRVVMAVHGISATFADDALRYQEILDAVICTNRLACRLVENDSGIEHNKVLYAPCGVASPVNRSKQLRHSHAGLRLAYVGRFDDFQKRVLDIPRILRQLDLRLEQWSLVLAGSGPEEGRLQKELHEWIVKGRVTFLGALSTREVVEKVYDRVDALLVTSQWETGPLVIWEAMASGVPVVTSRYVGSGLEGSLKHGVNCLLYPIGDATLAADSIQRLVNGQFRTQLAENAKILIDKRYTLRASVTSWGNSLEAVLSRSPMSNYCLEEPIPPAGRLDQCFGVETGETVRRLTGLRFEHAEPGGEWPHTYSTLAEADPDFWKSAASMDGEAGKPTHS